MPKSSRPLWKCPRCGHRFVSRNLWHSCVRVRLTDHFRGKDPVVRQLFSTLRALVRYCGPAHRDWLEAGLWLRRRVEHPRLRRVESFGRLGYGHYFRLEQVSDLDRAFAALVREAYQAARSKPGDRVGG
jgi:hypothetical protein